MWTVKNPPLDWLMLQSLTYIATDYLTVESNDQPNVSMF
jgi:hypothetical protein